MRWRFNARPEILRTGHQSLAEIGLPNAIDENPRRRWVPAVDNPTRQAQPVRRRAGRQRMQNRRHPRFNFLS
jgi:hypothetical protein